MFTLGFILALVSSFTQALKEVSLKNNLKGIDSNTLIFLLSFLSIILWFPFIVYYGVPKLDLTFWGFFFLSGTLFFIGKTFNFKAIQAEDISYIAPLKGILTIGVVITSMIILKERPSLLGYIGILLVLLSTYVLNIQKYHTKFLDPIIHLFTNRGSRFFLVAVTCYSITFAFDKVGVQKSYPIFWIFMMNLFLFSISFRRFYKTIDKNKVSIKKSYKFIFLSFSLYAISHITQMSAIKYLLAPYVSGIKTASMLFAILLGGIFFKEKEIKRKLFIGLFMVAGIVLIYFSK